MIDQQTTKEIGNISQLFVDIQTHQVVQVKCTAGFLAPTISYFGWSDIRSIESDSVLVDTSNANTFSTLIKRGTY